MNEPNANDLGEDEICEGLFGLDSDDEDGTDNAPAPKDSAEGMSADEVTPGAEPAVDRPTGRAKRERDGDEPDDEGGKKRRQREQLSALITMKANLNNLNEVMQRRTSRIFWKT